MNLDLCHSEIASAYPVVAGARAVSAPASGGKQYRTMPSWGTRRFESGDTHRLNQAHWRDADDQSVNVWLASQLATIRARATYEARNNGMILGLVNTHADDIVGPDGPQLQVISDDDAYNTALERAWQDWFYAPTHKPNVSGTALLKLWVRSLWKSGEFLAQIITDPSAAGPIKMRIRPIHPRRLQTPVAMSGNGDTFLGIRFDALGRPAQYFLTNPTRFGVSQLDMGDFLTVPPDLVIHEFLAEEEDQARGVPWLNPALQPAADLRDYDDQVQDAARQIADQSALLYTDHPDAEIWTEPDSMDIERRTIKMVPPGWKPFVYSATQPPVQYPEYRAERLRETGRPMGMPLMIIRLDSSKHNYSSARLDTQVYRRAVGGIQYWLSGTESSYGTLNRLADEIAREGRFTIPGLRKRPERVRYQWTWAQLPHVDPKKESDAETVGLDNLTISLTDALAARGRTLETHIATLVRERTLLEAAGLSRATSTPAPGVNQDAGDEPDPDDDDKAEGKEQKEIEEAAANA